MRKLILLFIAGLAISCSSPNGKIFHSVSYLTPQEKEFCRKLSPEYQKVFCSQFGKTQRDKAMEIAKQVDFKNIRNDKTPNSELTISPNRAMYMLMQSQKNNKAFSRYE